MHTDPDDPHGWHQCQLCGTEVSRGGWEVDGTRHFLGDCRPDLVFHEAGPLCTWPLFDIPNDRALEERLNKENHRPHCYAFMEMDTRVWTTSHSHFYINGPM